MTKTVTSGPRKSGSATWRKLLSELKDRHDVAFGVLNAQTEVLKANRSVQVAFGAGTVYALCTGRLATAALLAGAWLGSKPLTHVAAAGVACTGTINARLKAAFAQSPRATPRNETSIKGSTVRRRRRVKTDAVAVPVSG